ncbi:hypothetical protein [Saccharothrix australiensis]|uniref:Uncharacterized protein n=1 Tax=Saccharothrix australiensis TaxID=2072 RepID=A0A495VU88_9PSEU|nr:hypothetical protein [Saccharothrix australiensis]RKT52961.1 hypothetical protein C8E97_1504 [Saccharothrix australiensis]
MVVNAIRRIFAVAALCAGLGAGLGAVLAAPASADAPGGVSAKEIFTPPYVHP